MNTAFLLVGSIVYFVLAFFIYGKFLDKTFGVNPKAPCPSWTLKDGVDYVPAHPAVLFGHHFASIAGAGPIVGPVLAVKFGWLPALLWILLGCVFVGAMHDFAAMFLSVRNQGRSIAYVIEKELGYAGRQIFIFFCLATLVLVVTVFTTQVADGFIANPAVATASVLFIMLAPVFGVIINQKLLSLLEATLIFVPLMFLLIWLGTIIPLDLVKLLGVEKDTARFVWILVLLYYAFIASTIPVWFLLQPRDYLNSFLLYAMMFLGIGGIAFARLPLQMPAMHFPEKTQFIPHVLPLLFVTIACGACSGFHALVASGTSSKQIDNEKNIRTVGYGGMLLEGVLAVIAICSVGYLAPEQFAAQAVGKAAVPPAIQFANGVGNFVTALGIPFEVGATFISLAISAFMLTSLDTATRLARFLWQELIMPRADGKNAVVEKAPEPAQDENSKLNLVKTPTEEEVQRATEPEPLNPAIRFLSNRWCATLAIVVLAFILAKSGDGTALWPVFGSANQLMAAMTLLGITLYLLRKKLRWLFAFFPMLFMLVISVWALINLLVENCRASNWMLVCVGAFLLVMAILLAVFAIRALKVHRKS
ncbi:MAG: carbon starvation protein A [Victivallales bacterium]|nr:carbon starvation protein A [Victivallales bacterium]